MKRIFLGLGKVNRALAKIVEGPKEAYVEEGSCVVRYSAVDGTDFKVCESLAGSFDDIEWSQNRPAEYFVSPGIDPRRPFFRQIQDQECRELDFFCDRFKGCVIAITGTDGKSTFTTQLAEVLKRALPQKKIFAGGNLGTAMADALLEPFDYAVLEVSSFQCERIQRARPDYGILLNLSVDHLDRYNSLKDYFAAKWQMMVHAKKVFYPRGVDAPSEIGHSEAEYSNEASITEILQKVVSRLSQDFDFSLTPSLFRDLPTLPHRLELYQVKGRNTFFINDSKATTAHAVRYGYERMRMRFSSIYLILGGKFKGDDFRVLAGHMRPSDRILLCGEAREKIYDQIVGAPPSISIFYSLKDVMSELTSSSLLDVCVMLSPGCSSYDEFENFEERGKFFVEAIKARFDIARID